jgi:hypothetical protein
MNKELKAKYNSYPTSIKKEILELRELIFEVIEKDDEIDFYEETLKWGEPSFLTKSSGSTLRIDWKTKNPDCISLFVNCRTKIISIFKELYPNDFQYIGNREIRLSLNDTYSKNKLKKCIEVVLKYNLIKDKF